MSDFHLKLGQNDAKAGATSERHIEPLGWPEMALVDWRKGHGPGWVARVQVSVLKEVVATTNIASSTRQSYSGSSNSNLRPYTPFSTAGTKKKAKQTSDLQTPGYRDHRRPLTANRPVAPEPRAQNPKPQMGLFGPIGDPEPASTPNRKPNPIPSADRRSERRLLLEMGIERSVVRSLINNEWTGDQLCVKWEIGRLQAKRESAGKVDQQGCADESAPLPEYVKEIMPLVADWCLSKWPEKKPADNKDTEVLNVSAHSEERRIGSRRRTDQNQSA